MRRVGLTVPPAIASRQLGETRARVKDQLHSDANVTTQRSAPTLPSFHKRHHTAHCNARNRYREPLPVGKTVEGIASDVPRGVGAQRESHLLKRAPEVLAAYDNPAIAVHQIYSRFRISWDEFGLVAQDPRRRTPIQPASINAWKQPPRPCPIALVFRAKVFGQQPFLRSDASQQGYEQKSGDEDAHSRPKYESPPE